MEDSCTASGGHDSEWLHDETLHLSPSPLSASLAGGGQNTDPGAALGSVSGRRRVKLSEEERRARRRQANRESARRMRIKKYETISQLQLDLQSALASGSRLQTENEKLRRLLGLSAAANVSSVMSALSTGVPPPAAAVKTEMVDFQTSGGQPGRDAGKQDSANTGAMAAAAARSPPTQDLSSQVASAFPQVTEHAAQPALAHAGALNEHEAAAERVRAASLIAASTTRDLLLRARLEHGGQAPGADAAAAAAAAQPQHPLPASFQEQAGRLAQHGALAAAAAPFAPGAQQFHHQTVQTAGVAASAGATATATALVPHRAAPEASQQHLQRDGSGVSYNGSTLTVLEPGRHGLAAGFADDATWRQLPQQQKQQQQCPERVCRPVKQRRLSPGPSSNAHTASSGATHSSRSTLSDGDEEDNEQALLLMLEGGKRAALPFVSAAQPLAPTPRAEERGGPAVGEGCSGYREEEEAKSGSKRRRDGQNGSPPLDALCGAAPGAAAAAAVRRLEGMAADSAAGPSAGAHGLDPSSRGGGAHGHAAGAAVRPALAASPSPAPCSPQVQLPSVTPQDVQRLLQQRVGVAHALAGAGARSAQSYDACGAGAPLPSCAHPPLKPAAREPTSQGPQWPAGFAPAAAAAAGAAGVLPAADGFAPAADLGSMGPCEDDLDCLLAQIFGDSCGEQQAPAPAPASGAGPWAAQPQQAAAQALRWQQAAPVGQERVMVGQAQQQQQCAPWPSYPSQQPNWGRSAAEALRARAEPATAAEQPPQRQQAFGGAPQLGQAQWPPACVAAPLQANGWAEWWP